MSNLMGELEKITRGEVSSVFASDNSGKQFMVQMKALVTLHQTYMVLFYQRIDKLRIKAYSNVAKQV